MGVYDKEFHCWRAGSLNDLQCPVCGHSVIVGYQTCPKCGCALNVEHIQTASDNEYLLTDERRDDNGFLLH